MSIIRIIIGLLLIFNLDFANDDIHIVKHKKHVKVKHQELLEYIEEHNPVPWKTPIYYEWIVKMCDKYDRDYMLIARQINTECSFINYAVSHKGAVGPMQTIPKFWSGELYKLGDKELNRALLKSGNHTKYLKRIPYGIEVGIRALNHFERKHGDYALALVAYSHGDSLYYKVGPKKGQPTVFYYAKRSRKYLYNVDYVKKILKG